MRWLMLALLLSNFVVAQETQQTPTEKHPLFAPPPLRHPCTPTPQPLVTVGSNMSKYAADRENALGPAYVLSSCHDFEGALKIAQTVLEAYPTDARVLNFAAQMAMWAGDLETAIPLYQKVIAQPHLRYTESERYYLMAIYIQLGRWDEFEKLRRQTRTITLDGQDPSLNPVRGFSIDTFNSDKEPVDVSESVSSVGDNIWIRDKFLLNIEKNPCTGYTPHIDFETEDGNHYALVAYPTSDVRKVLKRYPDGEPEYKAVRADVMAALPQPLTKIHGSNETCTETISSEPLLAPAATGTAAK